MILGIFLSLGESFLDMQKRGQLSQFKEFYLKAFSENFDKVYIFSYGNDKVENLPGNVLVVPNKYKIHRYLYGLLIPFLNRSYLAECEVFRAYHLSGTVPAIVARIFFKKPFIFNWAYDYKKFALVEKKFLQAFLVFFLKPIAETFASKILIANQRTSINHKFVYLPNGVNTNFYRPIKVKKDKTTLILSVGRLERQKNFANLIKALKDLDVNLLLVGGGSLKDNLMQLAKEENISLKIIDSVENTKMPYIYSRADMFILPSIIEGTPKALLEAMSSGLPVIGTKVEGIKNIILHGKNGLLVEPDNRNIRVGVMNLINDGNLREKLAANARAFVKKTYDLKYLIKLEIDAIKSIKK